ncbi:cytochrome c1 [Paracoccaceae bacterium Fryx2]|nr:cytochrome c1 [Paracoccaceae bacterium Fryx2]
MIRNIALSAVSALVLTSGAALAAGGAPVHHAEDVSFSFEGPFGTYDKAQLQRGLQVYTEVCSSCHGMKFVPIRTLSDKGGPELPADQVRAYAANMDIYDPEIDEDRPRKPSDHFPTVIGDGMGPDLSVMAKARAAFHGPYGTGISQLFRGIGGPEYIVAIQTGYLDAPACAPEDFTGYYNVAFTAGGIPDECKDEHGISTVPGSWIAMPPPLYDGQVEFADGSENTVQAMTEDVAAFMMWTAEPKMMARKQAGFVAVLFLGVLSVLLYLTNKQLWLGVKGRKKTT